MSMSDLHYERMHEQEEIDEADEYARYVDDCRDAECTPMPPDEWKTHENKLRSNP